MKKNISIKSTFDFIIMLETDDVLPYTILSIGYSFECFLINLTAFNHSIFACS